MSRTKKYLICVLLALTCAAMLLPWFGFDRNISQLSGFFILVHPVTLLCIACVLIGLFPPKPPPRLIDLLPLIGLGGIFGIEVYTFLTWHIMTITGQFDLSFSLLHTYPEGYASMLLALLTFLTYVFILIHTHVTTRKP